MTCRIAISVLGLSIAIAIANQVSAATISIGSEKDASMFANNPTNTGGGNDFVSTGRNNNGHARRALLQFDIAPPVIPVGATINSVSLTLALHSWSRLGNGFPFGIDRTVELHRITSQWGNGTTVATSGGGGQGIASSMNGDVSWTYRSWSQTDPTPPHSPWTLAGGDFDASVSSSLLMSTTNGPIAVGNYFTWTGAGLAADVQAWVDGTKPNYGWLLLIPNDGAAPNNTLLEFYSRDAAEVDAAFRPQLTIDFTAAAAVPEPSTWMLAATGLVLSGLIAARYRGKKRGYA